MEQRRRRLYRLTDRGVTVIDQQTLDALIAAGMGRAALRLGSPYIQYRPGGAFDPLGGSPLSTINCLFDPSPTLTLSEVEDRKLSGAYLVGDGSNLQAGDYLVGRDTYFVSHIEPLRPASCTLCNHVLSVLTASTASAAGSNTYGGRTSESDVALASGWPGSLLAKSHIEMDPTRLPSDTKAAFYEILLPAIQGVEITFGLRLTDENGQSYIVSSAELTNYGWRLNVALQTT